MGRGLGIKAAIARAICHPAIGRGLCWLRKDRIPYRGCVIETTSPTVRRETKARLFWGLYASCEVRYMRRHLRHDLDVVELGARIRGVTCRIRKRLDPDRRLLAVEASPKLVALARRSLERNGLTRNVSILKQAICYKGVRPSGSSWATVPSRGGPPIRPAGMRLSTCRRPPCRRSSATPTSAPTLVSDIEGGEAGLLWDDPPALADCRQLIIELHGAGRPGRKPAWTCGSCYLLTTERIRITEFVNSRIAEQ